jgi:hypothetical protein
MEQNSPSGEKPRRSIGILVLIACACLVIFSLVMGNIFHNSNTFNPAEKTLPASHPCPSTCENSVSPVGSARDRTEGWNDIHSIEENWLSGVSCQSSCWNGITPGVTTIDQAEGILDSLPYLERESTDYSPLIVTEDPISDSSDWMPANLYPYTAYKQNKWRVTLEYDKRTNLVTEIFINFPFGIPLGRIIPSFGEPSYVIAYASYNFEKLDLVERRITLFWEDQGIIGLWSQTDPDLDPVIDSNFVIRGVQLHQPSTGWLSDYLRGPYADTNKDLIPWKGYGSFKQYCHFHGSVPQNGNPNLCDYK